METKTCGNPKCKIGVMPISNFYKNKRKKDGYQNYCKCCMKETNARSFQKHKKKRMAKSTEWQRSEKGREYRSDYYKHGSKRKREESIVEITPEVYQQQHAKQFTSFMDETREVHRKKNREYRRFRLRNDPEYKLKDNLRNRIRKFLKGAKSNNSESLIGCTWEELFRHIEEQFRDGMSWQNQGEWEIDHIIPCNAFKDELHLESNQRVLCWFQNLQPLWREDNRAKGGKYKEEDKQDLIRRYNEENLSSI